jgi:rod shape-determining protein MreD
MGRYLSIPILGFAAALSSSIIPQIIGFFVALVGSITPILDNSRGQLSLVMLLVIAWSIRSDLEGSFAWAFVGGIAMDLLSIVPIGASSFGLLLIVFVVNTLSQQIYRVNIIMLLAITIISTIFLQFFLYFVLVLLGNSYNLLALIRLILIPTLMYNIIAILPIYGFVHLIQRRLEGGLQSAPNTVGN